jgi:hypothetical protein
MSAVQFNEMRAGVLQQVPRPLVNPRACLPPAVAPVARAAGTQTPAGGAIFAPASCLPTGPAPAAAAQRGGRGLFLAGWAGAVLICAVVWWALLRVALAHGQELRVVFLICPIGGAWCEEGEMRWPRPITCDAAEAYIRAGLREGQTLMVQACEMVGS